MKVTCIDNTNKVLSEKALLQGYIIKTEFEKLKIGGQYIVFGISIWGEVMYYLIIDEDEIYPIWYPADLFNVVDASLPLGWHFNYFGFKDDNSLVLISGYKELATLTNHNDMLMERDENALKIFFKMKKELEF